jgi:predicted Ser/Thr protein kinase
MPTISPQLYLSALQHPDQSFIDEELKEATVVKASGSWMPYARSGKFAVVFKLETKGGTKAVRCFYSPKTEHEERYRLFHEHLHARPLGYLTQFEYLPQGILLGKDAYPIVKMDWVEGETLDKRVESMVEKQDVQGLEKLSRLWRDTVVGLRQLSVAHGDMQHANILTCNGSLCLVDYDGVFIPSFRGKSALEAGHRNYQHPGRAASGSFGLDMDHFSAFVIYFSLLALAANPKLWKNFHQDDHLILQDRDYREPQKSEILKTIKHSGESQVRELASKLEELCRLPVDAVPPFESLVPIPAAPKPEPSTRGTVDVGNPWWGQLQGLQPTPPVIPATGTPQRPVASGSATSPAYTQPQKPTPAPKKQGQRTALIVLFAFLLLAACAIVFLAALNNY